ncbi:hypothetical protein Tcan_15462 [Toxocara canis]|uniref:Uncharacterized protein n=1 Tax=Toxocara canis TaxID=6265 RepID=A0A0B2V6Q6_TOXCA|nr:hypothetical protein Tcan_15462 [Toxocara canis]
MFLEAILVAIHDRMDTRSAIADTMMMAMSTAMSANGFKKWRDSSKVTPGEWVHEYLRQKYPSVRAEFEKNAQLVKQHQQTITDIIEMAVESVDSLDDSLGPLLVSYASENGILEERG